MTSKLRMEIEKAQRTNKNDKKSIAPLEDVESRRTVSEFAQNTAKARFNVYALEVGASPSIVRESVKNKSGAHFDSCCTNERIGRSEDLMWPSISHMSKSLHSNSPVEVILSILILQNFRYLINVHGKE
jgi:hypothetical protein